MKLRTQKITALMAAAVLGISAFGSVPVTAAESTETADTGAAMMVDGEAVSSDLVAGTFKPSDVTCKAQDSYEYPFLGLEAFTFEGAVKADQGPEHCNAYHGRF